MSNSSSIPAGLPILGSGNGTGPFRNSTPAQTPVAVEAKPVQLFANPSFRFDPSVGLVVIEFHNATGIVQNSIPSQRQLAAYRTHQQTPPGQRAPGTPTASADAKIGNAKTAAG